MPDRSCWLHIGAPKTGSTAIQQFLSDNPDALAAQGCVYPTAARRAGGHHDLAFLSSGGYPDWAVPQDQSLDELLAALYAEIRTGPEATILSSENFYLLCEPATVADLMARLGFVPDNVTVVVYLRRQDEAALSWYNQAVKAQGYAGSLDEHIAAHHGLWDYEIHLKSWADAFGRNRLLVRRYEGDVRRDFLAALGLPARDFHFAAERINMEINRDILEFQLQINRLPLPAQDKRRFHKQLMALTAASASSGLFSDTPLLDGEGRHALLRSYEDSNRRVTETHFGGARLFDAPPLGGEATKGPAPGMTSEKLTALLGWLLLTQDGQNRQETTSP